MVGAFYSELIGQNINDIISHEHLTEFPVLSIEPKQSPWWLKKCCKHWGKSIRNYHYIVKYQTDSAQFHNITLLEIYWTSILTVSEYVLQVNFFRVVRKFFNLLLHVVLRFIDAECYFCPHVWWKYKLWESGDIFICLFYIDITQNTFIFIHYFRSKVVLWIFDRQFTGNGVLRM